MSVAVRPSLADAIRRYADDHKLTMTHIIIDFVCRGLRRRHYWPPNTLEERERKRQRAIIRRKAAAKRKSKPSRKQAGRRIGTPGRSIGGCGGKPIGTSRSSLFTP